jgi:hypothetical protein
MTTNNAASALSAEPAPAASAPAAATVATGAQPADTGAAAIQQAVVEATTPAAAPSPTAAPAANDGAWWGKIENQDVRTWAEAKGFKDPLSAVESAYNLEKLVGFDKAGRTIVIPDENATPEQVKAFHAKIGVPETAAGYTLPVPDGADPAFASEAASWFHKHGVPAKAAEGIVTEWNAKMQAAQVESDKQFEIQSGQEFDAWASEQGAALNQNQELARRASAQFIPAKDANERRELISKMEQAIGTGNFMKMMAAIGAGLGEGKMHQGGEGGLVLTPAQAQQRIKELGSNKEWTQSYLAGDKTKLAEMESLSKLASGVVSNG